MGTGNFLVCDIYYIHYHQYIFLSSISFLLKFQRVNHKGSKNSPYIVGVDRKIHNPTSPPIKLRGGGEGLRIVFY